MSDPDEGFVEESQEYVEETLERSGGSVELEQMNTQLERAENDLNTDADRDHQGAPSLGHMNLPRAGNPNDPLPNETREI